MKSETNNQEMQYFGILGLDRLPAILKIINFGVASVIGINLAFGSWFYHFYRGIPSYIAPPFLPLIFAWPLCPILIWLRLTGIRWIWCFVAAIVILMGYYVLQVVNLAIGEFMS